MRRFVLIALFAAAIPVRTAEVVEVTGPTQQEIALGVAEDELAAMRAADATLADQIESTRRALAGVEAGDPGDPRAHLRHDHRPQPEEAQRYGRVVEFWSAISAGVLLIFLVGALYVEWFPGWVALLLAVGGYVAIEAAFRRRLVDLVLRLTLVLAVVGAIVLAVTQWQFFLVGAVAGIAILAIVDNVRELRG